MIEKHYLDDVARQFMETIVKHTRKNLQAEGIDVPNIAIGEITSAGKYLEVLIRKSPASGLIAAFPDLLEAAKDFVDKVETGRARSKDSYAKFKAAIKKAEATDD